MARITVEDCLHNVKNRFELILVGSRRARELMLTGTEPTVPWKNDKATVIALREIAKGTVTAKILDADPVVRKHVTASSSHITEQDIMDEVIGSEQNDELFMELDDEPVRVQDDEE